MVPRAERVEIIEPIVLDADPVTPASVTLLEFDGTNLHADRLDLRDRGKWVSFRWKWPRKS